MKRCIVIGDIHGEEVMLKNLIKQIKFDSNNDKLIFVGDYIDRGPESCGVVRYLNSLKACFPQNVILLWGNHEAMARDAFYANRSDSNEMIHWTQNGGLQCISSFGSHSNAKKELSLFFNNLQHFYEEDDFVVVHAFWPVSDDSLVNYVIIRSTLEDEILWNRNYDWYNGKKRMICGHTPQKNGVLVKEKVVVVDTGAHRYGVLSAYDVYNNVVYQQIR